MAKSNQFQLYALFVVACLSFFACGSQGDIFGGQDNLPIAGVSPWSKIDFFPQFELSQPFVLLSPENVEYIEPALVFARERYWMFFEAAFLDPVDEADVHTASAIYLAVSDNGLDWELANKARPVLIPAAKWEGDYCGAPTVVWTNGEFVMYYSGGKGAGIGLARSQDGIDWIRSGANPVIVPDQDWEQSAVLSPSVVVESNKVRLWYAGGLAGTSPMDQLLGKAIGYAQSSNGVAFVKIDAKGHNSDDHPGKVGPVFTAAKSWEGYDEDEPGLGCVGMPGVFADRSNDRTVYRMYYSGHKIGDMLSDNVSIGYAGSFDGIRFERANGLLNPVVTETFVLEFPGITPVLDYDEFSGSVIPFGRDRFLMAFSQADLLDWLAYGLKGIALAACPPF